MPRLIDLGEADRPAISQLGLEGVLLRLVDLLGQPTFDGHFEAMLELPPRGLPACSLHDSFEESSGTVREASNQERQADHEEGEPSRADRGPFPGETGHEERGNPPGPHQGQKEGGGAWPRLLQVPPFLG